MPQVETARGPVDAGSLGATLMHEHVFVLNEEVRRNYPADWQEAERIDDAVGKLTALAARGCQTIVDPTVIGLGRDIARIQQVADRVPVNIIVATGLYTYNEVPFYFKFRGPGEDGLDPMRSMSRDSRQAWRGSCARWPGRTSRRARR